MIQKMKVSSLKPNPNNPRLIKDEKFHKLVESIRNFPEMLEARPIVVNEDLVVLGGNMRLKALIEAGVKEASVEIVNWDSSKQAEFIVKDNVSFGEWDWNELANKWNTEELEEWGVDVIKHDWEDLDYIEEDVNAPNPVGNNVLQIVLPEKWQDQKESIKQHLKSFLIENYEGCEVK